MSRQEYSSIKKAIALTILTTMAGGLVTAAGSSYLDIVDLKAKTKAQDEKIEGLKEMLTDIKRDVGDIRNYLLDQPRRRR